MIHELKTAPEYFKEVISGKKTFEIRKNDRPFHVGDLLALNEYDGKNKRYTGNSCLVCIDYILSDAEYCKAGHVVMSIKPCFVSKERKLQDLFGGSIDYKVSLATRAPKAQEQREE